jgi:hypothetical protein
MCKFFSAILTDKGELLHAVDIDDRHETIIEQHGLKDDTLKNRKWVRLEITPPNGDLVTPVKEWVVTVDERGTLPQWYEKVPKGRVLKLAAPILAEFIVQEDRKEISGGRHVILGSAKIDYVCGSAKIGTVRGSAKIGTVCDSAKIDTVCGSAKIDYVCGGSTIEVYSRDMDFDLYDQAVLIDRSVDGKVTVKKARKKWVAK